MRSTPQIFGRRFGLILAGLGLLGLGGLSLPASSAAADATGSPTGSPIGSGAARLVALLENTETLKAAFEQTVYDEQRQRLQDSRGLVYIQRPGRFRWDYQYPSPQLIVADGEKVSIYDEELAQVTVRSLDAALGNTPALLLTQKGDLGRTFRVKHLGRRDELDWIELTPRATDATFELIRLGFDDTRIRMMEMADNFGQLTELRFSDAELNVPIDAALFRFTPPAGVDVLRDH